MLVRGTPTYDSQGYDTLGLITKTTQESGVKLFTSGGDNLFRSVDPESMPDFHKAYSKLVHKVIIEQGSTKGLLVTPEEASRYTDRSRASVKEFMVRTERSLRERETKVSEKRLVKESSDLKECTFRPQLVRRSKSSLSRTLKQFLQDQSRFEEARRSR